MTISPGPNIRSSAFGLYAITTRCPRVLAGQVALEAVKPGVYRLPVVGRTVTLIVLREVEPCPRNALWEIFSFEAAKVFAGADTYRWRRDDHVPSSGDSLLNSPNRDKLSKGDRLTETPGMRLSQQHGKTSTGGC